MNQPKKERFKTSVGGQALMEGIMMRGPKQMCCAVRKPDGTIETKLDPTPAHGVWMKIPLVRGAIAMIESMIVGYRYMMYSAQVSMGDDYDPAEEETAFEKWVGEHLGEKAENALLTVAAVLGGLLAIVLFTVLPTFLVGGVNRLLPLVMGISYELLKWCGRSDNIATRIIRQPGIWVQHLTVFEPDDSMIEVAIAAITPVLPENPEEGKW